MGTTIEGVYLRAQITDEADLLPIAGFDPNNADYIAIGSFNYSKTKRIKYKASINNLRKFKKITNKPIVAIGGIDQNNYKKLLLNKADFLAISSFIWKNKKLKPMQAIEKLK